MFTFAQVSVQSDGTENEKKITNNDNANENENIDERFLQQLHCNEEEQAIDWNMGIDVKADKLKGISEKLEGQ